MRELTRIELCYNCTIAMVGGEDETTPPVEWQEYWEWLTERNTLVIPSGGAAEFRTETTCERCGDTLAGYRQPFVVLGLD